jgi:hypothetical protein
VPRRHAATPTNAQQHTESGDFHDHLFAQLDGHNLTKQIVFFFYLLFNANRLPEWRLPETVRNVKIADISGYPE